MTEETPHYLFAVREYTKNKQVSKHVDVSLVSSIHKHIYLTKQRNKTVGDPGLNKGKKFGPGRGTCTVSNPGYLQWGIQGGTPGTRPSPGVQILSFSCSFRQKICKIIG